MKRRAGLRSRSAVGAVLLLAVAATAAAQQDPTTYVAFGDSITQGVGDEEGLGYPPRLQDLLVADGLDATVRNRGLPGETTTEGLTRLDSVLEEGGDVLLLMEGTNDLPHNISIETVVFDVSEMARKAEEAGLDVIVATVIPRSPFAHVDDDNVLTQQFNEQVRDMAGTSERTLADPFEVFVTTPSYYDDLYSHDPEDPVGHPNGAGYDLMAGIFADVIRGIDSVPPVTGLVRPQVGRTGVRPGVNVRMDVWDFGEGIDVLSTEMLINGVVVDAAVDGGTRVLSFQYAPPEPFTGLVQIGLRSRDRASPPNTVDRVVSSFRVSGAQIEGDVDGNGRVDGVDLVLLARSFGANAAELRYLAEADFNNDNVVDGEDLAVLAAHFGESAS